MRRINHISTVNLIIGGRLYEHTRNFEIKGKGIR